MTSMNRSHNNRVPIPILESTPDVFFESAKSYYDGGTEADERLRWYAPTNGVITLSDVSTYGTVTKWGTDFNRQAILYVDNHGLTGDSWTGTTDAGAHSDLAFASAARASASAAAAVAIAVSVRAIRARSFALDALRNSSLATTSDVWALFFFHSSTKSRSLVCRDL